MPLLRYFLFAGGFLLALISISDAYLPKSPMPESAAVDMPMIRIRSDRKWPERVVYDTSIPAVQTAKAEPPVAAPAVFAEVAAKSRMREAFAQLPMSAQLSNSARLPMSVQLPTSVQQPGPQQIELSDPAKPQAKPQPKRKVAKKRPGPPMVLVAQQPPFGFFANSTW
jgi:hypothetical protein